MLSTLFKNSYRNGWTRRVFLVSLVACLLMSFFSVGLTAYAEPREMEPVEAHCLRKVSSRVRSSCPEIAARTRTAASHKCVHHDNNKGFAACIKTTSTGWIDRVAKKLKSQGALYQTSGQFNKQLDAIFKKENVDPNKPAPDPEGGTTQVCAQGQCYDPAIGDAQCQKGRCDLIGKWVSPTVNLLSLVFGVIAAASLIAGGIQYMASTGDSQKITLAKRRITNTLLAVVAYLFLYAFLQFLIPGGTFRDVPKCPADKTIVPPACKV